MPTANVTNIVRALFDDSIAAKQRSRDALPDAIVRAAQAMQGKGEIELRTRVARRVTLAKKLHKLAISVQIIDTGPGVSEEIRDRIFFPLVSGREDGSGLGLTLAQTFVSQHHGSIELESEPGRTCFSVLLPIDETNADS